MKILEAMENGLLIAWDKGEIDDADLATGQTLLAALASTQAVTTCQHCDRVIELDKDGRWIDPEAPTDTDDEGNPIDDGIWRETCDRHDAFVADHEPVTS